MILCCGEALIDMLPQGGLLRPMPGGGVFNTAVGLGRLGVPTGFLWPISRDPFGEMLLARLTEAGVDTGLCPRPDRPTSLAFVTLSEGEARYDFYDDGTAGREFSARELPTELADVTALMVGGISLVPDPCGAAVETLVAREAMRIPVMLDPNIRPAFIADDAAHRARILRFIGHATIVKLSGDDLGWLWPGLAPAQAAAEILRRGPKLVLTTEGSASAAAFAACGSVAVPALPVTVSDSVGAGDSFNAGVLAALHRAGALSHEGLPQADAATLHAAVLNGIRAAAITVSRPGADPPWARELP